MEHALAGHKLMRNYPVKTHGLTLQESLKVNCFHLHSTTFKMTREKSGNLVYINYWRKLLHVICQCIDDHALYARSKAIKISPSYIYYLLLSKSPALLIVFFRIYLISMYICDNEAKLIMATVFVIIYIYIFPYN